jgi:hypothetical protein
MRFFVDESGLTLGDTEEETDVRDIIEDFLEVLDASSGYDDEPLARSREIYDADIRAKEKFCDFLYPKEPPSLLKDSLRRLIIAIERIPVWEIEREPTELDVVYDGRRIFAPTLARAWEHRGRGEAVGCIVFSSSNRLGEVEVDVDGRTETLHFISELNDRPVFFRKMIAIENVDHHRFSEIAPRAFPQLLWVDSVWNGLRSHSDCFFGVHRTTFVEHLAVLNDRGATIFHACPGGNRAEKYLDAAGVDASPENGKARSYSPSIDERTRIWRGKKVVFWWHTKINWDKGRIHFIHEPRHDQSEDPEEGRIVIGIFTDHCVLPN